jgi:hypothetical protein
MKTILSLLLAMFAIAPPISSGNALYSMEINTEPFWCDGKWKSIETAPGIEVRRAELWMGMDVGSVADMNFVLVGDNEVNIFRGNLDHYAEPTGIDSQIVSADFRPDYISASMLTLYYRCQSFKGKTHGHLIATVWYYK